MPEHVARARVPHPLATVRAWHDREGAVQRLTPPWQRLRVLSGGGSADGSRVTLSLVAGPTRRTWVAVHWDAPDGFRDVQERGPFASWDHLHRFLPDGDGTIVEDTVRYRLPLYSRVAGPYVRAELTRAFAYRQERLARDLARHAGTTPARIAVTGSSGLLGARLCAFLSTGGHEVVRVSRAHDARTFAGVDAVVHLAGETISQRWTPASRERIMASRRDGTRKLAETLAAMDAPPKALVSASAIGLYGDRGDEPLPEDAPRGDGFLADVVEAWEAAAQPARDAGIRTVNLRFGIVLAAEGGALKPLLLPFRLGAGGPIGKARQWWSWVHIEDAIGAIHKAALDPAWRGPVNVVAPTPVRNREFVTTLGRVLGRPALAPLPRFAARAMVGAMADDLLFASQRVVPAKLEKLGFAFEQVELERALRAELGKSVAGPPPA